MRLAILSDIHGNLEALEAVLRDMDEQNIDRIMSLGDNIGYGPDPEAVTEILRELRIESVVGNHEWALMNKEHMEWFNPFARKALLRTEGLMSEQSLKELKDLPVQRVLNNCLLVHGCPPDSINTYLFEVPDHLFFTIFMEIRQDICFVGHTHMLELIGFTGGSVIRDFLREGSNPLEEDRKYIINIGSVGQPRDGNNHAKYVIWDETSHDLTVRYIPYDIQKTAGKILSIGMPRVYADRLW